MDHTSGPIVLFVDDDENILRGLTRVLRNQPYRLFTARSGEEAMRVLMTQRVSVIIADEQMPGMSGTDLLAWVSENCPETIRMVLTGHASTSTAIRAINEGSVFRFFTKPCNEVDLALAIREALDNKKKAEDSATPTSP
ncbi:MAG: response regulator [Pirellulales bacterium]|nr:response regulator [Pirellulales bacterium]